MKPINAAKFVTPRSRLISRLGLVLPFLLVLGCSGSVDPEDFEIVDTWVLSDLEGASGNYNSQWTFAQDGTYQWTFFSDVLGLDLNGGGTYTLSADILSVTGIVATTVISTLNDKRLTLTLKTNSFSFLDEDGSRWTYTQQ